MYTIGEPAWMASISGMKLRWTSQQDRKAKDAPRWSRFGHRGAVGSVRGACDLLKINRLQAVFLLGLYYAGKSLLLTGDIEHETDNSLLRWGDRLHADVLKAAHHGSRTSSTDDFLRGVQPAIVTVSCGIGNKFGHPGPEIIQRYVDMGLQIWRTDQSGAIVMQLKEDGIYVTPWIKQ